MLKRFLIGVLIGVGIVYAQERVEPIMVTHMQQSHAVYTQLHAMEHVISIPYMTPLERDAKRFAIAQSMHQNVQALIEDMQSLTDSTFVAHIEALKNANAMLQKGIEARNVALILERADALNLACDACHAQFRE